MGHSDLTKTAEQGVSANASATRAGIRGIDHIELFVADAQQSASHYSSAFGFTTRGQGGPETGLVGRRSVLMSQAGINLVLTSGLYPEHPAAEYVRRHGDGVAVIAMEVDDATAVFDELVARGAGPLCWPQSYSDSSGSVIVAEVAGVGDVIHRLVERRDPHGSPIRAGAGGNFLPGVLQPVTGAPVLSEPLVQLIDHFAVCVPAGELQATVNFYRTVFGFDEIFSEYIDVADQGMDSVVVQSESGLVTFTLIEPDTSRRPGQVDQFLQEHGGGGVQHVALITDDIVDTVSRFTERGARFLRTPVSYYEGLEARVNGVAAPIADLSRLGHSGRPGPLGPAVANLRRIQSRPPDLLSGGHRTARRAAVRQRKHQGALRGQGTRDGVRVGVSA